MFLLLGVYMLPKYFAVVININHTNAVVKNLKFTIIRSAIKTSVASSWHFISTY